MGSEIILVLFFSLVLISVPGVQIYFGLIFASKKIEIIFIIVERI